MLPTPSTVASVRQSTLSRTRYNSESDLDLREGWREKSVESSKSVGANRMLIFGLSSSCTRDNRRFSPAVNANFPDKTAAVSPEFRDSQNSAMASSANFSSNGLDLAEIPLNVSNCSSVRRYHTIHNEFGSLSPSVSQSSHSIHQPGNSSFPESDLSKSVEFKQVDGLSQANEDLNFPNVEDGLSSDSDFGTPAHCSDLKSPVRGNNRSRQSTSEHGSKSSVLTGRKPVNRTTADGLVGSLVNPPLVRDIWGIVSELKQTLSEDHSALTKPSESLPSFHASLCDVCRNDVTTTKDDTMVSASTNDTCHGTMQLCNEDGSCSKLVVRASVECSVGHVGHDDRFHELSSRDAASLNRIRPKEKDIEPSRPEKVQHWTFPTQSNNVYSSSDDEISSNPKKSDGNHTSDVKFGITPSLKMHDGFSYSPSGPSLHSTSAQTDASAATDSGPTHSSTSGFVTDQPTLPRATHSEDFDSDEDTDQLLGRQYQRDKPVYIPELRQSSRFQDERQNRVREVSVRHPDFPDSLINGALFSARYLGSTQLPTERHPTRYSRMVQAQEAVSRIKAPEDENQPSVSVELFVSTNRLMILNKNLQEILIDHELKMVSYIADIGDLFVLMTRRPLGDPMNERVPSDGKEFSKDECHSIDGKRSTDDDSGPDTKIDAPPNDNPSPKMSCKLLCHVLESSEARLIAQTVGHCFQLAYLDFLRENGIDSESSFKQLNYADILNQQEIFCDELAVFSDKTRHKQITIPKQRGEALGVAIVASGWGSVIPSVLLANMNPTGPAARCGQLNIGNHMISVNGQSLVGLPVKSCRQILKNCRQQTSVKLVVVDCLPVIEVLIRRPSLQYQLGFSVQDGVICSLLRGGIAERGGIRVDHRIIEINGQGVVAVPHEKIVQLLTSSVGEIHMRTMPTSIFRLLTGQDTPNYV